MSFRKKYPPTKPKTQSKHFSRRKNIFPNKASHPPLTHSYLFYETCAWRNWQQQTTTAKLDSWISFILKLTETHRILLWTATKTTTTNIYYKLHHTHTKLHAKLFYSTHKKHSLSSFWTVLYSESFPSTRFFRSFSLICQQFFFFFYHKTTKWHLKDKMDRVQDTQFKWNPGSNLQLLYELVTHITVKNDPYL